MPQVDLGNLEDLFHLLREKYKNHPITSSIVSKQLQNIFSFRDISEVEIQNDILCMNDKEIFPNIFSTEIHKAIKLTIFASCMKKADVTSVFKKGNRSGKDNYHPVNILPNLSKFFERYLYK